MKGREMKLKTGIVGAGFIGPIHIENLRRLNFSEVYAVARSTQEGANSTAEKLSIPKAYGKWQDLVKDKEVDVVHITTPNKLHFPIAKACLENGKHVICEKPLTLDTKEAKELANLAGQKDVANAVSHNMNFYPLVMHAKEMVKNNELGRIFLAHGKYLQDWLSKESDYNWRVEAKYSGKSRVVGDIGSHWIEMVQLILAKKVTSVFADATIFYPKRKKPTVEIPTHSEQELKHGEYEEINVDTEDHATIMFKFEDGVKGVLIASQVCPGRKQRIEWEINGAEKSMSWNGEEPNLLWVGQRNDYNGTLIKDPITLADNAKKYAHYPVGLAEGYPDSWKNLFMEFYTHVLKIKEGKKEEPRFPTFKRGYEIQMIIDSIMESAEKNKWVDIKY